jgi:transposase InsO family protein
MDLGDAGTRAKFVLHDRDASFTQAFDAVFQAAGIRVIRSAVQAPRMNSIAERWIGSCRRELLDRTLIWNLRHLMMVLREYEDFYNSHRPSPGVPSVSHDVAPVALRIAFATHLQGCGARCCRCSEARPPWTCHMHDNLAWRRRVVDDATTCTIR